MTPIIILTGYLILLSVSSVLFDRALDRVQTDGDMQAWQTHCKPGWLRFVPGMGIYMYMTFKRS